MDYTETFFSTQRKAEFIREKQRFLKHRGTEERMVPGVRFQGRKWLMVNR